MLGNCWRRETDVCANTSTHIQLHQLPPASDASLGLIQYLPLFIPRLLVRLSSESSSKTHLLISKEQLIRFPWRCRISTRQLLISSHNRNLTWSQTLGRIKVSSNYNVHIVYSFHTWRQIPSWGIADGLWEESRGMQGKVNANASSLTHMHTHLYPHLSPSLKM